MIIRKINGYSHNDRYTDSVSDPNMRESSLVEYIKDTHGFTLVELIVVLVIVAILAAAVGPAFLGYIDKAKENQTLNNAKKLYMAAQHIIEQAHSDLVDPTTRVTADRMSELTLMDITDGSEPYSITYKTDSFDDTNPSKSMYIIERFIYDEGSYRAKYERSTGKWEVISLE